MYSLQRFDPGKNKEDLYRLRGAGSRELREKKFEHMYGVKAYPDIMTCMLYSDREKEAAGVASVFERGFEFGGNSYRAGFNIDISVKPAHRTLGPALLLARELMKEAEKSGCALLIANPNEKSRIVFERAGYRKAGASYRWSKVLRSAGKLPPALRNSPMGKPAAAVIDLHSSCRGIAAASMKRGRGTLIRTRCLPEEAGPVSALPGLAAFENSPGFLRWRYGGFYETTPEVYSLSRSGSLVGAVFYTEKDGVVSVENILTDREKFGFEPLVYYFTASMRKNGASSVSVPYFGDVSMERALGRSGFIRRESRDVYMYFFDRSLERSFADLKSLMFFSGDLDL